MCCFCFFKVELHNFAGGFHDVTNYDMIVTFSLWAGCCLREYNEFVGLSRWLAWNSSLIKVETQFPYLKDASQLLYL